MPGNPGMAFFGIYFNEYTGIQWEKYFWLNNFMWREEVQWPV